MLNNNSLIRLIKFETMLMFVQVGKSAALTEIVKSIKNCHVEITIMPIITYYDNIQVNNI